MDVLSLLRLTYERRASDLHLKASTRPVLRVDGVLEPVTGEGPVNPADIADAFCAIATEEQQDLFRRNLELDFAYSLPGVARFRVNAALQRGSIVLSFRLVPVVVPSLAQLAMPTVCQVLAARRRGLVVVTGPTGSGKSTTLAAMIDNINSNERRRIVTIEDPIEFLYADKLSFIIQREVGADARDFPTALRSALRQDPDVILLGEMRDQETIATAIAAAETGHLVLGTLHTIGAAEAVDRIINVFPPGQQQQVRLELSLCLEGVVSQMLLPRASGKGRVAAMEVMIATPAVRNLIRDAKAHQIPNMIALGAQFGMQTFDHHLHDLVLANVVSFEEAMLRATQPEHLRKRLASDGVIAAGVHPVLPSFQSFPHWDEDRGKDQGDG
ncbi:MAG: PilT/PilU family type 4a pilus ATPase [Chloroflexi bacterium]|nr:PilT/PilU family type 4a pilus ATPase [Chloroflexota bacterium]